MLRCDSRRRAPESFDFAVFNRGDYYGAVNQKVILENLSKVLYPNDEQTRGKELRLERPLRARALVRRQSDARA